MADASPGEMAASADQWEELAWENGRSAQVLLSNKLVGRAYAAAGLAVECALKARIMRHHRMTRWPPRDDRPDLYTHDLGRLLNEAGLRQKMGSSTTGHGPIMASWMVVKDWTNVSRFKVNIGYRDARDMVEAVTAPGTGVLEWILNV